MLTRTVAHLDQLIVDNLHKIRSIPFDVVVHIPRSGTIPASLIATYLCRPLASVEEFKRGIINKRKSEVGSLNRILLVDDSIRTGKQMIKFISEIQAARPDAVIYTLSVYSTRFERSIEPTLVLDTHNEVMYIYPWFMWKTERIEHCAVDMDGVLCRDCTREEDDDGKNYLNFIRTAEPKFKPLKHKIGVIITSRLEKYRPETIRWLSRNGIQYNKLVMGQWDSIQERRGKQAAYKAGAYLRSGMELFIESSSEEAKEIARMSEKAVWCIDDGRAY